MSEATTVATIDEAPATVASAPVSDTASILDVISRSARDESVDVEKLERLMCLYERLEDRRGEAAFNAAMTDAQSQMGRVATDSSNDQTRSRYASYAALDRALRPIYTAHGFSISFGMGEGAPDSHVRVVCYCGHSDGFTREYHADIPADGKGAKGGDIMTKTHATGSAFTYGKRYLLTMIFNIAIGSDPDDDDGNAARGRANQAAGRPPKDDWVGPLNKTTLKEHLRALSRDMNECTDTAAFAGCIEGYSAVIKQCEANGGPNGQMKDWWESYLQASAKLETNLEQAESETVGDFQAPLPSDFETEPAAN